MRADVVMAWFARMLLCVGVVCLSWVGYVSLEASRFQHQQAVAFERLLAASPPTADSARTSVGPASSRPPSNASVTPRVAASSLVVTGAIGMLEIPRLDMTAAVMSGDDEKTLRVAAGHLPDTPAPWESGNSAIAAHRDGLFRPLSRVRVGDEVRMRTAHGELNYRVVETRIVMPDDLSVLRPTDHDSLTLIMCYPFNSIGDAPQRFIVRAERLR